MQHEIITRGPLLDPKGDLAQPGYAKKLLPIYRRAAIKASPLRIKEWDYYLINNGRFALALTVDDNGYMSLDSVSVLNFDEGWEITTSPMGFMPLGRVGLPETSAVGDTHHSGKGRALYFKNDGLGRRVLTVHMDKFGPLGALDGRVELFDEPEESMVICTPFDKPGHFYFNQKINCLRADGSFTYGGKTYVFDPAESFAVLDWGRGVWTYHNTWYWGSASGQGRRAFRLEHRLRLRQHRRRHGKYAFLRRQGSQALQCKIQHPRRGKGLHVSVDLHIRRRAL